MFFPGRLHEPLADIRPGRDIMKNCIISAGIVLFVFCSLQTKAERGPAIRASLSYNIMALDLRDRKFAERTIRYMRDEELYAGAAASYNNFGLAGRLGVFDVKNQNHKKVDSYDLKASYFSSAFGAELYYSRYSRFYISSSPYGIGRLWNDSHSGSGVKSEGAGLNLFLFMKDFLSLNENFSYNAAFLQTEQPVKTSGTLLVLLSADYLRVRNNVPLIPAYAHDLFLFMDLYGLKGWRFAGFGFGVGFAGTLVLPGDLFVSSSISLMVRPLHKEFYTLVHVNREFRIDSLKGQGKIYAGYNGGSFFAGVSFVLEAALIPSYRFKLEMWSGDLAMEFYSGVRI
ncbi:MAG: hypothetical protein A2W19_14380 [Spirochaetes bacterium RBG_16_49_21]|nr:MAG: hypothetical protein A2W19_14380 [Spirochaetes bacterium RBG_16_49_21]